VYIESADKLHSVHSINPKYDSCEAIPASAGFIFLLVLVHEAGEEGGGILGDGGQVRHDGQQVQGHRQR